MEESLGPNDCLILKGFSKNTMFFPLKTNDTLFSGEGGGIEVDVNFLISQVPRGAATNDSELSSFDMPLYFQSAF